MNRKVAITCICMALCALFAAWWLMQPPQWPEGGAAVQIKGD